MEATDGRVRTWAEIAAYIGRDARTAQRYERSCQTNEKLGAFRSG